MPAFFQFEVDVEVQILEDGVGSGDLAAEPALCGALQVILALHIQICLEQVVHDYEPHLHCRTRSYFIASAMSIPVAYIVAWVKLIHSNLLPSRKYMERAKEAHTTGQILTVAASMFSWTLFLGSFCHRIMVESHDCHAGMKLSLCLGQCKLPASRRGCGKATR